MRAILESFVVETLRKDWSGERRDLVKSWKYRTRYKQILPGGFLVITRDHGHLQVPG